MLQAKVAFHSSFNLFSFKGTGGSWCFVHFLFFLFATKAILLGPNTKAEKDLCGHAGEAQKQAEAYKIEGCQVHGEGSDCSEVQSCSAVIPQKVSQ